MKTKMTLLIVLTAIVTLSFSFASSRTESAKPQAEAAQVEAPVGGLVSEKN